MGLNMSHLGLSHSHSMATSPSDFLNQSLQGQRELYHHEAAARSMSAQLQSDSPFELGSRDGTHFGEQAAPLHAFGSDDIGHDMGTDMGLMDGDMLEMLLKPE